jgi:RNA polymerase sigma-70 factor (ECF subfamily)
MSSSISPESLLAQVALGDRKAFEGLYRATADRLFAICMRVLSDRGDAEEAVQETFTSVWRKAAQFNPGRASAMSWLGMIARNKAIDRLRELPARTRFEELDPQAELADPGPSPAQDAEAQIAQRALERCIDTLEPQRRSLIRAAFFDGFTYEELAARARVPLGSVKSWIRRGLMQLRTCLEA